MKAMVTGGAGFIGSHLVDGLLKRGFEVSVIDNLSTGKIENLNSEAKFFKEDICSSQIHKIFKEERPDYLFHLAAQIDVRKSVENPFFDAQVNILGTLNLLKAALDAGTKKIVFASSGGVIYGQTEDIPTPEGNPLAPISPYGIAKLAGEIYLKFYAETYDLPYIILRYANVYGPRQDPLGEAGVVAIFSLAMLKGEKVILYGYGKLERDYVFVEDVVKANILALENQKNGVFNIGTAKGTSVEELFQLMKKITGFEGEVEYREARSGELERSCLSFKQAQRIFGWSPKTELETGLQLTVEWFKEKFLKTTPEHTK
ncbi:MAG: NAD-dependent epimerase/dehydratase family protein [Candidatus Edwardsbacteria bacterium]